MATKEVVKKEAVKKEVAVSPFVIFKTELADIREAMSANVGAAGASPALPARGAPHGTSHARTAAREGVTKPLPTNAVASPSTVSPGASAGARRATFTPTGHHDGKSSSVPS